MKKKFLNLMILLIAMLLFLVVFSPKSFADDDDKGWVQENGKWYYFDLNSIMFNGSSKVMNGKTYRFDSTGALIGNLEDY